jgi:integrase
VIHRAASLGALCAERYRRGNHGQDHPPHLDDERPDREARPSRGLRYTLMVNGRQERKASSAWLTEADALEALAERQREVGAGVLVRSERTLGELAAEYLAYKRDHGKRSVKDDERILERGLVPAFGAGLPVRRLTGAAIAQYEKQRMAAKVVRGDRKLSAYTVSNELSVLRHMLRLARRWGCLDAAPEIVLPKTPRGRLRYLDVDEIGRLLDACRQSRNRALVAVVVLALNTGMRKGEILGLEWERIDLSSARIRLIQTKSGRGASRSTGRCMTS